MSRRTFEIAYAGPSDEHSMDVQELAPALLGIGQLIREANTSLNGKKATVKVMVVSDFEHKCFNINFDLVQSIYSQLTSLLATPEVEDAKRLLEWIGLVGGPASAVVGLLKFLQIKRGRKIVDRKEITDANGEGVIILRIEGDYNTITINSQVERLASNPKVLKSVKDTLAPIGTNGIDRMEFRDGGEIIGKTTEQDAVDIVASCEIAEEEVPILDEVNNPEIITWLKIYSPVLDRKAANWRFIYQDHHIYADVTDTSIVSDAIERGFVGINDVYKVKMSIIETIDKNNKVSTKYKIKEVLEFIPAPRQTELEFLKTDDDKEPGNA